ncbi:hypothetical protein DPMN_025989 [Dreissena polymorpha]|uniref:Uncharacterized protein n=1 Tax=Dreissena polymorpha TaxID=45954 RepID=A0A9D4LSI8_DREPO|nr:hypothetical protein DPMN_025989 [Dreissena polymorpha]
MQETPREHHTSISIGGRPISNLTFADDMYLMVAPAVNFKISPTNSRKEQDHTG